MTKWDELLMGRCLRLVNLMSSFQLLDQLAPGVELALKSGVIGILLEIKLIQYLHFALQRRTLKPKIFKFKC